MKKYKIDVRGVKTVPIRRAESGMTLARSVSNRDGQLIMKGGRELTDSSLMKLKRFDIRRVAIEEMQQRWVTEPELSEISEPHSVIDERREPESAEETTAETATTVKQLRQKLQQTERQLRRQDEGDASAVRRRLRETYQLEEELNRLERDVHERELDPRDRQSVLDAIRGLEKRIDRSFLDLDVPDNLLFDTVDAVNDRESLRNQLMETDGNDSGEGGTPETQVLPDFTGLFEQLQSRIQTTEEPEEREWCRNRLTELKDLEERRDDLYRSIFSEVNDAEVQSGLLSMMEEPDASPGDLLEGVTDPSRRQQYNLLLDSVTEFSEQFRSLQGDIENGPPEPREDAPGSPGEDRGEQDGSETGRGGGGVISETERVVDTVKQETDDAANQGRLEAHRRRLRELDREKESLKETIRTEVEDERTRETVLEAMEGNREIDPDLLDEFELEEESATQLVRWINRRSNRMKRARDDLEELRFQGETDGSEEDRLETLRQRSQDESLEELKMFIRTGPSSDEASPASPTDPRLEKLDAAINRRDSEEISRYSDMPENVVSSALRLFKVPEGLETQRRELLEAVETAVNDVMYRASIDRDRLERLIKRVNTLRNNSKRPFSPIICTPDPRKSLLPHSFNNLYVATWLARTHEGISVEPARVALACLTLDTGLTAIPESMVFQENPSSRVNREYMKHPLYSEQFVERTGTVDSVEVNPVAQHHEREDGTGFPRGLSAEELPPHTRFVQVVDKYTRLIEDRVEQSSFPPGKAMERMEERREEFGSKEFEALRETIGFYPDGTIVVLTDGRLAFVYSQNSEAPKNPELLVLTDLERNRLSAPDRLKLSSHSGISIKKTVRW